MIPFMVAVARPHGVGDSIYSGDSKTTATWMSLAIARSQLVAAYWDHDADAKGGKRTICTYFGKPATSTIIGLCGLLEVCLLASRDNGPRQEASRSDSSIPMLRHRQHRSTLCTSSAAGPILPSPRRSSWRQCSPPAQPCSVRTARCWACCATTSSTTCTTRRQPSWSRCFSSRIAQPCVRIPCSDVMSSTLRVFHPLMSSLKRVAFRPRLQRECRRSMHVQ
mmetsp:Transcript_20700/g.62980  ORF Transcript_20700/g.62980 Transcript_20700/m.62980 type:complete len:222 (+) Transcript_20700:622-1287(+)